ncbi:MAG: hypothetical protein OER77_08715 [Myxococcales bacterium]|nr:hypothetical protein [Myxococcales bacterium]
MGTSKSSKRTESTVEILQVDRHTLDFFILGTSPLVLNAMSGKAKRELLLPHGRKTAAERATTLKHMPPEEFVDSIIKLGPETRVGAGTKTVPTRAAIGLPSTAFKKAMSTTALRIPGVKKTEIGQLTYVEGYRVEVFGTPMLFMEPVRSADMSRTPDIRTRAILPEWACQVSVTFIKPLVTAQTVFNLMGNAGMICGVGDYRPEKGVGNFGQFTLVDADDETWARIVETQAREVQLAAIDSPECYDSESSELLAWYEEEVARREAAGTIAKKQTA